MIFNPQGTLDRARIDLPERLRPTQALLAGATANRLFSWPPAPRLYALYAVNTQGAPGMMPAPRLSRFVTARPRRKSGESSTTTLGDRQQWN